MLTNEKYTYENRAKRNDTLWVSNHQAVSRTIKRMFNVGPG